MTETSDLFASQVLIILIDDIVFGIMRLQLNVLCLFDSIVLRVLFVYVYHFHSCSIVRC